MLAEGNCKVKYRYLVANFRLSPKVLNLWKKNHWISPQQNELDRELLARYLAWSQSEFELALFTMYAYADFQIPKRFNCIFDLDDCKRYAQVEMNLIQSIYEGMLPIACIEDGHKHLAIFRFEREVPDLIRELYYVNEEKFDLPREHLRLGICQLKDLSAIKMERERQEKEEDGK